MEENREEVAILINCNVLDVGDGRRVRFWEHKSGARMPFEHFLLFFVCRGSL